ncbi:T6SS immunity protein Tdi1 domain-containing protein [Nocardioides ultimimeridianus]
MWRDERLLGVAGYSEFAAEFAGVTFSGGLYRVHDVQTGPQSSVLVAEAFPELAQRTCPFAYDWLGRQFAVDVARVAGGVPQVLLLEPGTGEALEIPTDFIGLHDEELIEYADAALAVTFFDEWKAANSATMPLGRSQCAGYKVPLFLGGRDVVDNLEVSDIDVYWSFCGQLRQGVRGLPADTPISAIVKFED